MTEQNNLENPFFLFTLLLCTIALNIVSSIHFILIMLGGILFLAFNTCLKKRYLYSLSFVIISFLFIEINSGLKPFSLSLLSLFLYIFILPAMNRSISFESINNYVYIVLFYIGVLVLYSIESELTVNVSKAIFLNALIDMAFLGLFL